MLDQNLGLKYQRFTPLHHGIQVLLHYGNQVLLHHGNQVLLHHGNQVLLHYGNQVLLHYGNIFIFTVVATLIYRKVWSDNPPQ